MAHKKAKVTSFRRNSDAAKKVEERHIGYETVDWGNVLDFDVAFRDTLRHYGYFYDIKVAHAWALKWVKSNYPKIEFEAYMDAPKWKTPMTVCSMCKMMDNGAVLDDGKFKWLKDKIDLVIKESSLTIVEEPETPRKSPADIVKEKTSDFIAEIEYVIDEVGSDTFFDIENYSVYKELEKAESAYNTAKAVVDYYTPQRDEFKLLVGKKPQKQTQDYKDLVEGYSNMPLKRKKEHLKLLSLIVSDAELYMSAKKAVRKPRKTKSVSVGKQISKVNYMRESKEYKLTSVDPTQLIGAKTIWLFNTKYRTITVMETTNRDGMKVKGTTVYGFDEGKCTKKTIRKPEEFLSNTANTTKFKLKKAYNDISTKTADSTGRIGPDTIIYRVFK